MTEPVKNPNRYIRLKNVKTRDLTWFWQPYIPGGALTMLHGPGGMGKTHITCAIATAVSTGEALPGQKGPISPQTVLMLSAEDDLEVILAPRLNDMGADGDRIVFPATTFVLDKKGVDKVEALLLETGATLVFIDPVVQYMGGKVDMNRMNEVRTVMNMLSELARKYNAAIVFVHHDRKSAVGQNTDDQDSAAGSADFRNAVRSSMKVAKYPDGRSVLHHDKSNWSKPGGSLTYVIGDDGFEWGEVITTPEFLPTSGKTKPREAAVAFIRAELASGPLPAAEIELRAIDEGFNKRTLARAKVGIAESYYSRNAEGKLVWFWRLAGTKLTTKQKKAELDAAKKSAAGFRSPADQVKEINNGSKIHTVGDWLKPENEEPAVGGKLGVPDDDGAVAGLGTPDANMDQGRPANTGAVASDFAAEIEEILRKQGLTA